MNDFDLSTLFSSGAKYKVLKTLVTVQHPLSLRQIERFTGLAIRSIQVAVEGLVCEGILIRRKNKSSYILNQRHRSYGLLLSLFTMMSRLQLEDRAPVYAALAQASLKFSDEMLALMRAVRM